jgi:ABC-2 type transport system permease protein
VKKLRKYLGVYWAFCRFGLTADLEFRANFVIMFAADIFWYVAQISSFEVLFNFTDHIGGWNRGETRVFLGILFVVDAISMVVLQYNLDALSERVRTGSLDLLLSKPVNSQFMISLQRVSTAHLGNFSTASAYLAWALWASGDFSLAKALWLFVTVPCGVIVFYTFRFLFSAPTVIFANAGNLQYLFYHFYRLGMRPDSIYTPWIRYVLLSLVPMALLASVPARLVLGMASPWLALWAVLVAAVCLWATTRIWAFALRRYTSASS